jgi:hypothetical protein
VKRAFASARWVISTRFLSLSGDRGDERLGHLRRRKCRHLVVAIWKSADDCSLNQRSGETPVSPQRWGGPSVEVGIGSGPVERLWWQARITLWSG